MLKQIYLLIFFVSFSTLAFTQIARQSFESSGDTWTPITFSTPPCTSGDDIWDFRASLNTINPNQGAQFWGIQDLNGDCGGSGFETISLPNVDVSGHTDVEFSFDYNAFEFDNNDDIKYELFYDDASQGEVVVVDGASNFSTNGWETETVMVPGTVTNVRVILSVRQNGGGDYAGLDDVKLTGTVASADTRVQFTSATSTLAENGLFIDIPISITNPSSSSATTVEVNLTGGTATNGTDYDDGGSPAMAISFPQTITFPANSSADQNFTVYISNDDGIFEGNETVLLALQNPSGGTSAELGAQTTHTLTITDNDLPALNQIRINETNCTPTGSEFIELHSVLGLTLDGLVLVHFNGNGNTSLWAVDLDGITISSGGFYVICEETNANSYCNLVASQIGSIQDGPDAVAIYVGDASDFPNGTPATATNLVDAIVYDTDDADDDLLGILGINEPTQQNENGHNSSATHSVQRGSLFTAPETPGLPNQPLPIELSSFSGKLNKSNQIELNWSTVTEIHNAGFEIQKSHGGENWESLKWVEGAGNSIEKIQYIFIDPHPIPGKNYYRLKQIDFNGTTSFSKIISIDFGILHEAKIFPTITNGLINVELGEMNEAGKLISIYNTHGTLVREAIFYGNEKRVQFDFSDLQNGVYILNINSGNSTAFFRFIKK